MISDVKPKTLDEIVVSMLQCEQTQGQTVYQHGLSVRNHLEDLIEGLSTGNLTGWKVPDYWIKYKEEILSNLHSRDILIAYTIYHDCGKGFVRQVDDAGRVHFPDHAKVSGDLFEEAGGSSVVANLIRWDMVLHTASAEEIDRYCREVWTVEDACSLLLAALAEIHSNSKLFGGIESLSFKSKWKTIDRRGKQICKFYFGDKYANAWWLFGIRR